MDLFRYFDKEVIENAERVGNTVRVMPHPTSRNQYVVEVDKVALARSGFTLENPTPREAVFYKSIGEFMKQGPVIARPSEHLSRQLSETDASISVGDYKQPYKLIGVELQLGMFPIGQCRFVMTWNLSPDVLLMWTGSRDLSVMYFAAVTAASSSIEESLVILERENSDGELVLNSLGFRLAVNVALLMTHRGYTTEPLEPKVARHRRGNDERNRRLANRVVQSIILRELAPPPRPPVALVVEGEPTGRKLPVHLRRGHWKRLACGVGRVDRKLHWIEPYWTTGGSDDVPPAKPIIVYQDRHQKLPVEFPPC